MDVLDYVQDAIIHFVDLEDVKEKIMSGEGKFGKLDLKNMDCQKEAIEEVVDLFAYCHASKYTGAPL